MKTTFSRIAVIFLFIPSCVYHDLAEPFNCELSDLELQLNTIVMATNCTMADGGIDVTAFGGKPPYRFKLNNGTTLQEGNFTGIAAGIYTVSVRDGRGCEVLLENVAVLAEDFSFSTTLEEDNLCLADNGKVTIEIQSGNPPYMYKLEDGEFTTGNSFEQLNHGPHNVQIKDANDCITQLTITVPRGKTETSWSNHILPIMITYCGLDGCHDGEDKPDLRVYSNAKFYATLIKVKTADRSMPFEGTLTQEQIDIIACWVDDGALNN